MEGMRVAGYLTKSRFSRGVQCPQKLVYEGHPANYVDQDDNNAMLQGLAEGGHQIGALAQTLFKQADGEDAYEITAREQSEQIEDTREALESETVTLFEPTIVHDRFLVRVDVLRKRGNRVDLIEVKSKSFDSSSADPGKNPTQPTRTGGIDNKWLPYMRDIAFQYWVVTQAYPDWDVRCQLMMPDKAIAARDSGLHQCFPVRLDEVPAGSGAFRARVEAPDRLNKEHLGESFLQCIPVDDQVQQVLEQVLEVPGQVDQFHVIAHRLADLRENPIAVKPAPVGAQCKTCEFYTPTPSAEDRSGFHECWADRLGVDSGYRREDTVFGLFSPSGRGAASTRGLLDGGTLWLSDVNPDALGWPDTPNGALDKPDRQRMQVTGSWPGGGDYYFDREGFARAFAQTIETTGWPIYFLDFEGARSALPFRAGAKSNEIQIFQFSIHRLDENGQLTHADEFIDLSTEGDVNVAMVRRLKQALGSTGTVMRWSDYENTVLNEARSLLLASNRPPDDRDDLVAFIETLTEKKQGKRLLRRGQRNMVDQAQWAAQFYFHPLTRGSSSIKAVLPAVMGSSSHLRELYSRAIYGTDEMPSKNFSGETWWVAQPGEPGEPQDPYALLAGRASAGSDAVDSDRHYERFESIAEGGSAMMAYIRSQSGAVNPEEKTAMEKSLLRYCELDTLAMAMIMQAWRAEAGRSSRT